MSKLGVSIYPEHSTMEQDKAYLQLAAKYGFKRIFTCLLSATEEKETIKKIYKEINGYARDLGFEVIFDVAPVVFEKYGISYDDLSFFQELNADGIRLDEGYNGLKESVMTFNPQGLKIEINASSPSNYIDNILSFKPNINNIITCHNFYPQKYTGLGYNLFYNVSKKMKDLNLKVAAFVSSQEKDTFGPWPIDEGLCTLEMHRNLPIDLQTRHMYATEVVDDVIIANAFASEEELASLSKIQPGKVIFKLTPLDTVSAIEHEIIYDYPNHLARGDMSDYMARSTTPRVVYKTANIPPTYTPDLKRGDIVVLNNLYGRYKGELHIVLQDMKNDGRRNLVGKLAPEEHILLDYIEPWKKFAFMK